MLRFFSNLFKSNISGIDETFWNHNVEKNKSLDAYKTYKILPKIKEFYPLQVWIEKTDFREMEYNGLNLGNNRIWIG